MNAIDETVLVLTTGGTIDKLYFDALSAYQIEGTIIGRLLEIARVTTPYKLIEFSAKDSLEFDDDDRARLLETVRASSLRRVVITHGTDTMSVSARALAEIPDKTIVLTGAFTPARFAESDAAFNVGMAFATAQVAPPGIYVAMSGAVFPGDQVVKDRALGKFIASAAQ
ncbi:MAG TPA: asparaginase domain-containing protein [Verrucomicrobiae bacterium]|jgi:L-asparaginase|nr:asparaginase domain-containing protein [Verrucomicrobiae bacterium]